MLFLGHLFCFGRHVVARNIPSVYENLPLLFESIFSNFLRKVEAITSVDVYRRCVVHEGDLSHELILYSLLVMSGCSVSCWNLLSIP